MTDLDDVQVAQIINKANEDRVVDYATAALQGLIAREVPKDSLVNAVLIPRTIAQEAFRFAAAMIEERKRLREMRE